MKLIRLRNKRPAIAAPAPIPALAPVERDEDLLIVEVEYGMVVAWLPMTEVALGGVEVADSTILPDEETAARPILTSCAVGTGKPYPAPRHPE
jgi:hypothetical protein